MQVKLIVVGGKVDRTEVRLRLPAVLGRSRGADLTLGHPSISRRHCRLCERNGMVVVEDLQSTNGTFVEDRRVEQAPLEPGARLRVGPLTFVVVYDRPRSEPPVPIEQESAVAGAEPQAEEESILLASEPPIAPADPAGITPSEPFPPELPAAEEQPMAPMPPGLGVSAAGEASSGVPVPPGEPQGVPPDPLQEALEEENEEDEQLRRFLEGLQ